MSASDIPSFRLQLHFFTQFLVPKPISYNRLFRFYRHFTFIGNFSWDKRGRCNRNRVYSRDSRPAFLSILCESPIDQIDVIELNDICKWGAAFYGPSGYALLIAHQPNTPNITSILHESHGLPLTMLHESRFCWIQAPSYMRFHTHRTLFFINILTSYWLREGSTCVAVRFVEWTLGNRLNLDQSDRMT